MSLFTGSIFGVFWPELFWTLLKLAGYAVIGLTFGRGREFVYATFFQWSKFVNSTFFQWSTKLQLGFYMIWRIPSGGKLIQ